jgi:hypothetical protein
LPCNGSDGLISTRPRAGSLDEVPSQLKAVRLEPVERLFFSEKEGKRFDALTANGVRSGPACGREPEA